MKWCLGLFQTMPSFFFGPVLQKKREQVARDKFLLSKMWIRPCSPCHFSCLESLYFWPFLLHPKDDGTLLIRNCTGLMNPHRETSTPLMCTVQSGEQGPKSKKRVWTSMRCLLEQFGSASPWRCASAGWVPRPTCKNSVHDSSIIS